MKDRCNHWQKLQGESSRFGGCVVSICNSPVSIFTHVIVFFMLISHCFSLFFLPSLYNRYQECFIVVPSGCSFFSRASLLI